VIESRRLRWVEHVAHTGGKMGMHMEFWWGNLMKRDHLEDMGTDGSVIWKWSLEEIGWEDMIGLHFAWDRDKSVAVVNMVLNMYVL
jgi:hypothetical protein